MDVYLFYREMDDDWAAIAADLALNLDPDAQDVDQDEEMARPCLGCSFRQRPFVGWKLRDLKLPSAALKVNDRHGDGQHLFLALFFKHSFHFWPFLQNVILWLTLHLWIVLRIL